MTKPNDVTRRQLARAAELDARAKADPSDTYAARWAVNHRRIVEASRRSTQRLPHQDKRNISRGHC